MIKIIDKSGDKLVFETDIDVSLVNALRRSVNEIPVLAVDQLEISKNDSALYDEIIAHRAGLIPLKNESLKLPDECDCKGKGCNKCSIKFKLSAKGPKAVYSSELSPKGNNIYETPIVVLEKDQELEFVAVAKVGKGIEHAKFSPGILYYGYMGEETKDSLKEDEEHFNNLLEDVKSGKDAQLKVTIESWGQIPTKDIFISSITALNKNLKDFSKLVK